jgi:aspartyl-tRNA synthetase
MSDERIWIAKTTEQIGKSVLLKGWVNKRRNHGKLIFVDLRDRSGLVQVVFHPDNKGLSADAFKLAGTLRSEDVIEVRGMVAERGTANVNPDLPTGTIEVQASSLAVISRCADLPFEISQEGEFAVEEAVRLKYRYLDLRRPEMQRKILLRSEVINQFRWFLLAHDFVEVETPMLTKSTPEGSRDFIVPSRMQPGKFYALPQSPQQYKQLLMVAGLERYFQFPRCIRDEDLRANRGFEFTQLDLEMSFVEREDVLRLVEDMTIATMEAIEGKTIKQKPFPRFHYQDAISQFGADKFDLREDPKDPDELAFAWVIDWPTFERNEATGGWTYSHNPFTGPATDLYECLKSIDIDKLNSKEELKKIESLVSTQYDLVCNGEEVAGGGIRVYDPEALVRVFEIIGHSREKIQEQFGHILEAFTYGVPPHGGIAFGLDRLIAILTHDDSIKEVIPFPMTASGRTAIMDAPSEVDESQLIEVGLQLRNAGKRNVFKDICAFLDGKAIAYKTFEHKEVRTSEEAACVRGTNLASGAKALVVKADDGFHLVVISAACKLDSKKLRAALGTKKTRFATEDEVKEHTTCEVGAVPPFGNLLGLKTWVDTSITKLATIDFNAGERTRSIEMRAEDFLRVVSHEVVDVGE